MTAYIITGATATANVATDFTPNGIPVFGDTLVIGASKTLTIPSSYTFDATVTMGGTSTSARSKIINNGTWQLKADQTINAWSDFQFNAGSTLDGLGSNGLVLAITGTTNVPFKIICSGTEANPVLFTRSDYTTGEPARLIRPVSGSPQGGMFDATYLIMNNMTAFSFGGGNNAGNHFRLQNVVFDSAGNCITAQNSNLADDWIIDKVDYRHTHVADISSADLMNFWAQRNTTGTPTGIKRIRNLTLLTNDENQTKQFRVDYPDYIVADGVISDGVVFRTGSSNATTLGLQNSALRSVTVSATGTVFWKGTFEGSILVQDASDYPGRLNFHPMPNYTNTLIQDCYFEGFYATGTVGDASDWYLAPTTGSWTIQRCILVDPNGGAFTNSVNGAVSSDGTLEHNTYIAKKSSFSNSNPYGMLMRSESGIEWVAGTNTVRSNICWVYNNLSADGIVPAIFFDVPTVHNQLDVMDNNTYYNCSPTPPTGVYKNVITDGKTIGDVGFGAYDNYVNPQMTNFPSSASPIIDFASTKSKTTTKQLWAELLRLNGFNESTRKQETSNIIGYGVSDILTYVRNCVKPSNPLLATSAHDGTSRGAVQFTSLSGGGITFAGLTVSGLTSAGLTYAGMTK